jgi:hypothetical protein
MIYETIIYVIIMILLVSLLAYLYYAKEAKYYYNQFKGCSFEFKEVKSHYHDIYLNYMLKKTISSTVFLISFFLLFVVVVHYFTYLFFKF